MNRLYLRIVGVYLALLGAIVIFLYFDQSSQQLLIAHPVVYFIDVFCTSSRLVLTARRDSSSMQATAVKKTARAIRMPAIGKKADSKA